MRVIKFPFLGEGSGCLQFESVLTESLSGLFCYLLRQSGPLSFYITHSYMLSGCKEEQEICVARERRIKEKTQKRDSTPEIQKLWAKHMDMLHISTHSHHKAQHCHCKCQPLIRHSHTFWSLFSVMSGNTDSRVSHDGAHPAVSSKPSIPI